VLVGHEVAQCRGAATESQDRHREHHDARGQEAGAFVVAVGELGGQGDVGHLEQAERRGGAEERHQDPHGPGGGPERGRHGEGQQEEHRQQDAAGDHEAPAGAVPGTLAVAGGTDDRVDHDVPHLGEGDDEPCRQGGHTERVGEVVDEHETGQGAKPAGADRAHGIAGDRASAQRHGPGS
jgi:hypothetical protein